MHQNNYVQIFSVNRQFIHIAYKTRFLKLLVYNLLQLKASARHVNDGWLLIAVKWLLWFLILTRVETSICNFQSSCKNKGCFQFLSYVVLQIQASPPFSIYRLFTGSNQSPFSDLQAFYRVKSVPLFDLQAFYRVKSVPLFRFTGFLQGQISPPFSIYRLFTGSNQPPFFDLQAFYRVKSAPLFRFTGFLQGYTSPPFSIYGVFTGRIQSPFLDLQAFYWFYSAPIFLFTGFLRAQGSIYNGQGSLPSVIYMLLQYLLRSCKRVSSL